MNWIKFLLYFIAVLLFLIVLLTNIRLGKIIKIEQNEEMISNKVRNSTSVMIVVIIIAIILYSIAVFL
ncbi:ribose/xylose/arabinose/galactoside ABC-type transport systems, permease component [Solibacillus silvestris StLB046]|uniref:Ribose/xylose/arabinose/galactoside ABC-type transport systems, permease component n=1 Tax=Solibacillus silvestris (strain StLB046) TaxID=1002809 RepID=F2F107_SOLSS|nr:ribose/xylose/arabinose/galactoside ABC-type transport systems, permease component [Solibacillus silvestris StLB046]